MNKMGFGVWPSLEKGANLTLAHSLGKVIVDYQFNKGVEDSQTPWCKLPVHGSSNEYTLCHHV